MPLLVHAMEAVEAGLIQVDEESGALGVRHRARVIIALAVSIIRFGCMRFFEPREPADHGLDIIADRSICRDEVRVHIGEERRARLTMKEERAAADKGLDVTPLLDGAWEEGLELR